DDEPPKEDLTNQSSSRVQSAARWINILTSKDGDRGRQEKRFSRVVLGASAVCGERSSVHQVTYRRLGVSAAPDVVVWEELAVPFLLQKHGSVDGA
ncbi:hypothetical protein BaRGS_00000752, partial [Batillaria attramentaria]